MIKVLKGPKTLSCNRCGCEFSFENKDIFYTYKLNNHEYIEHAYVKCPICVKEIEL